MGCRLSRTDSTEICEKQTERQERQPVIEKRGPITNGNSVLLRRDTPQQGLDPLRNGVTPNTLGVSKPIGEVESASQADFFRMLDAKIEHGPDYDSDLEK